jgi:hypothetical protein
MGNQIFFWSPIAVERFSALVHLSICGEAALLEINTEDKE